MLYFLTYTIYIFYRKNAFETIMLFNLLKCSSFYQGKINFYKKTKTKWQMQKLCLQKCKQALLRHAVILYSGSVHSHKLKLRAVAVGIRKPLLFHIQLGDSGIALLEGKPDIEQWQSSNEPPHACSGLICTEPSSVSKPVHSACTSKLGQFHYSTFLNRHCLIKPKASWKVHFCQDGKIEQSRHKDRVNSESHISLAAVNARISITTDVIREGHAAHTKPQWRQSAGSLCSFFFFFL